MINQIQLERAPVLCVSFEKILTKRSCLVLRGLFPVARVARRRKFAQETSILPRDARRVYCREGRLLRGTRVVIPTTYQGLVFTELHMNHPDMAQMKSLARLHVWWTMTDQEIEQTVRDCTTCQANPSKSPSKVSNPWNYCGKKFM